MSRKISHVAVVVKDYDEVIDYYTNSLGVDLIEDTPLSKQKRWVLVSPGDRTGTNILLAKAANETQESRIGKQTGGRVFLFLQTDNFQRDYEQMKLNGVKFIEEPRNESFGKVVIFKDLYGNRWDLIERIQT